MCACVLGAIVFLSGLCFATAAVNSQAGLRDDLGRVDVHLLRRLGSVPGIPARWGWYDVS